LDSLSAGWLGKAISIEALHPFVDLRIMTNNNPVDLAGEGPDFATRYGDGAWYGTHAVPILEAPMTPLCAAGLARRLGTPGDLGREVLLQSYRPDEWKLWFDAAGVPTPPIRGPIFEASPTMAAAAGGAGVALLPGRMFEQDLASGRLMQPFALCIDADRYWLTRLKSRPETPAMTTFRSWLQSSDDRRNACTDRARAPSELGLRIDVEASGR
jgi:LysR family transcriptional regulator of beta-lactamase